MKRVAVAKAVEHLQLAKAEVENMHLTNGVKSYEIAWSQFLSQVTRVYSKLEQGAKGCKASEPWFGKKRHERRNDPLLSYLQQARNCDEHTIEHITQRKVDSLTAHFPPTNECRVAFEFMVDDQGKRHYRNIEFKSPNGGIERVEYANPDVELVTIKDARSGKMFHPPETHLNKPIIDRSPKGIAILAVAYLEQIVEEASKLSLTA